MIDFSKEERSYCDYGRTVLKMPASPSQGIAGESALTCNPADVAAEGITDQRLL